MDWIAPVIGIVAAGGLGLLAGFFIGERRARSGSSDAAAALAIATEKASSLEQQLARESQGATDLRQSLSTIEQKAAGLAAELRGTQDNLSARSQTLQSAQTEMQAAAERLLQAEQRSATLAADLRATQQGMAELKQSHEAALVQLRESFSHLSAEALAKNSESFLNLARERFETLSKESAGNLDERKAQIEGMLKPMNEVLTQYQSRLAEIEKSRTESYSMLREDLGRLGELQRTLNTQTNELVTALRRPSTRGQWGELTLRRLVEMAGMADNCDFCEQVTVAGEDSRSRPDMVIRLPGDREVVIDAKATLDAFLDATSAADEDQRKSHLQRHAQQVRSRARELWGKAYWNQFKRSPEFVVMFLPGEAFLYAAVEHDPTLLEDCLNNRVIVSTPTTLIALLRTIEMGWRQEAVTRNAEQIQQLGRDLYDRIATLGIHFAKLGANLSSTVEAYNKTVGSIEGRLLSTARKMSELGAKSDKPMPPLEAIEKSPRSLSALADLTPMIGSSSDTE